MSKLQQFIEQQNLHTNEGAKGFSNLCRIVRAIGYKDPLNQGSLYHGGNAGDLMVFFEDNPGAIDATIKWIDKQKAEEWDEELSYHLNEDDDIDEEDDEE